MLRMARRWLILACGAATVAGLSGVLARGQAPASVGGVWSLNRAQSELPREIGFNADWFAAAAAPGEPGGRSNRGAPGAPRSRRPSLDDSRRVQLLNDEARNPPARLMIVDTPAAVTLTNELGQSRIVHPDGKEEMVEIQGTLMPVLAKRDGETLVVTYRVDSSRDVTYSYSRSANPPRLTVVVQVSERGKTEKAKRVYDPGVESEPVAPKAAAGSAPAAPSEAFDQRPGAELRGLKALGILVEELGTTATGCGLNPDAIENALAKRLGDAGFAVRKNSDEDTYVYVNIQTTTVSTGTCVSRYDVFLYSYATVKLSYREQSVLAQV